MEVTFELNLEEAAKASQGGRITTGVYKVTIEKAYVYKTEKGNNLLDLELRSENGEVGFINRLCIDKTWASGAENFDYPKFQELAAAAGMKSLTLVDSKRKMNGQEEDAKEIAELKGKTVKVAVYQEFDVYNNKEKVSLKLANTFLADGRSVAEAMNKQPASRIVKIEARLSDYHTDAWKAWKQQGGCATETPATTTTSTDATEPEVSEEEEDDLFG